MNRKTLSGVQKINIEIVQKLIMLVLELMYFKQIKIQSNVDLNKDS